MIKLFQYPGSEGLPSISPPCLKVQLTLRKMGLEYETVDLKSQFEAKRHSPTGRLPTIDVDGERTCESSSIIDLLEQRFPAEAFFPTDPFEAAQDRLWDEFASESLYSYVGYVRWLAKDSAKRFLDCIAEHEGFLIGRVAVPLLIAPGFRKRMRQHGIGRRTVEDVSACIGRAMGMIEACLQGGPFLYGRDEPGRGDISVATHIASLLFPGGMKIVTDALEKRPAVREHTERVLESCSVEAPAFVKDLSPSKGAAS